MTCLKHVFLGSLYCLEILGWRWYCAIAEISPIFSARNCGHWRTGHVNGLRVMSEQRKHHYHRMMERLSLTACPSRSCSFCWRKRKRRRRLDREKMCRVELYRSWHSTVGLNRLSTPCGRSPVLIPSYDVYTCWWRWCGRAKEGELMPLYQRGRVGTPLESLTMWPPASLPCSFFSFSRWISHLLIFPLPTEVVKAPLYLSQV